MKLVVWHNLNKDTYYYKRITGFYKKYKVGFINQYNHQVILIIDDVFLPHYKLPLRKRVIKRVISFLQKIDKKL